jgi:ATP adenylyltransferase
MSHEALWAPWRMTYLRDLEAKAAASRNPSDTGLPNFLAAAWARPDLDRESLVVVRDANGLILLNRFPYTNGHLLVALGEPAPRLLDYAPERRAAFWTLVDRAFAIVHRAFRPQGINMGINEGHAAGAGLPEHLHAHVLPRWNGDTNFMAAVGSVRVIPDALETTWTRCREAAGELGFA